jgi:hypothetical protein
MRSIGTLLTIAAALTLAGSFQAQAGYNDVPTVGPAPGVEVGLDPAPQVVPKGLPSTNLGGISVGGITVVPEIEVPPAPPPPRNPGSKVWVLPLAEIGAWVELWVLNPSNQPARVTCVLFTRDGVISLDDYARWGDRGGRSFTLGRGATNSCIHATGDVLNEENWGNGWMLAVSDVPLLAVGNSSTYGSITGHRILGGRGDTSSWGSGWAIQPYPVDCTDPTGFEFVCQFVRH